MTDLAALLSLSDRAFAVGFVVFLRVGAAMALLPAFGEQMIPVRVRLALGLAFTMIVAPAVAAGIDRPAGLPQLWLTEPLIGLVFGLSLRLVVMGLRIAGTVAAQSTSLAQVFAAAGAEPSPVMGQLLVMAGLALAVTLGLHLQIAEALIDSYRTFPVGSLPASDRLLDWALPRIASTFALGVQLSMPFVIGALIYNVGLGIINRAMPQMMVAMVGAPALTFGGLVLLLVAAPIILDVWLHVLSDRLVQPF